ncbi:hippocampus abundant transcript 1 [Olea europaea subsp. europaea]|uniref:Hippocampus abundant transcript 1 n=1 Tax=Olea europaea subsp. europaea TaxID=158383 RepID=A0A8S0SPU9_OLEEU|nr:hippocampus abundant transcript 1 [Olea europaea subsp. europaea]
MLDFELLQLILMPILTPLVEEEKLLSIVLFFNFVHIILYGIAWTPWVPYAAAMISLVVIFAMPCGKAQGYVTGICSFDNIISPLAFSPLAALFLSNNEPFHFPGFSIMCSGLAAMIAFIQSIPIRANPPFTTCAVENSDTLEP